jgi:hypothetical protein
MEHGPVDVLIIGFGTPKFEGHVMSELAKLAAAGTIRVLDAMVVLKQTDGSAAVLNVEDLPEEELAKIGYVPVGTSGLFDEETAEMLAEGAVPGSAAAALAIEHSWAVPLVNAIVEAGAEVGMHTRIPAAVVDEAFAALEGTQ